MRSTTSAWTTTCSSPGTRPPSGCTRSSTTCSTTGARRTPSTPRTCAWSGTGGRSAATRSRRSWPATTCPTGGTTWSGTTRPAGWSGWPTPRPTDLPLVLVPDGETLRSPTTLVLADALGLRTRAAQPLYDVCIVGGGPAGLAAAVYAASEGLSTVIVEREAPGGQAGTSAAIENYLGLPARAQRCRPHRAGDGPGLAVRRRDGARPRRGRLRVAGTRAGGAARRRRGRSRPGR